VNLVRHLSSQNQKGAALLDSRIRELDNAKLLHAVNGISAQLIGANIAADGYLLLTGRIKEMINRGGEKISPYEIDAVLQQHPAVLAAATFPILHDTLGGDVAAAVVVCDRDEVKVPARIFLVEEIPCTTTGKPRRGVLSQLYQSPQYKQSAQKNTPRNESEDVILVDENFDTHLHLRPQEHIFNKG